MDWSTGAIVGSYKPKEWWVSYGPITLKARDELSTETASVTSFGLRLTLIDLEGGAYDSPIEQVSLASASANQFRITEALVDMDDGSLFAPLETSIGTDSASADGFALALALVDLSEYQRVDSVAAQSASADIFALRFTLVNLDAEGYRSPVDRLQTQSAGATLFKIIEDIE